MVEGATLGEVFVSAWQRRRYASGDTLRLRPLRCNPKVIPYCPLVLFSFSAVQRSERKPKVHLKVALLYNL
jgi:hypothetical protein